MRAKTLRVGDLVRVDEEVILVTSIPRIGVLDVYFWADNRRYVIVGQEREVELLARKAGNPVKV